MGNSGSGGSDLFESEMKGVTPLSDRERVRPPSTASSTTNHKPAPSPLHIEKNEHSIYGYINGVSEQQLRLLRSGTQRPEAQLDLHRMRAHIAKNHTIDFLTRCANTGIRLVLIIHGRGLHSGEAGPVLRDVVLDCLTNPPVTNRIRAFCTAAKQDGGAGAMYVALTK